MKILDKIQERINARLKKVEETELTQRTLDVLLQLYQLKAWIKGDN